MLLPAVPFQPVPLMVSARAETKAAARRVVTCNASVPGRFETGRCRCRYRSPGRERSPVIKPPGLIQTMIDDESALHERRKHSEQFSRLFKGQMAAGSSNRRVQSNERSCGFSVTITARVTLRSRKVLIIGVRMT